MRFPKLCGQGGRNRDNNPSIIMLTRTKLWDEHNSGKTLPQINPHKSHETSKSWWTRLEKSEQKSLHIIMIAGTNLWDQHN